MAIITDGVKTKFTDDTGLPLIGGQVFSYVEGTSTPKDTYQDRAFTIPNTNPIILDDVGSCQMYLKGGYRLRVLTADGVLVEEKDNAFQSDGQVLDVVANTTAIAALQTNVDVLNTRGGLKTDENNHIIGQGKAESATVYDLSLRSDKIRVSAPTDVEFGDLVFKTYAAPTVANGVTIPTGTWLNPALVTPLLGSAATKNVGVALGEIPTSGQVDSKIASQAMPINVYGIGSSIAETNAYLAARATNYYSAMHNTEHLRPVTLQSEGAYGYPSGIHFRAQENASFGLFYSRFATNNGTQSIRIFLKHDSTTKTGLMLASGINAFADGNGFWKTSSPVVRVYANEIDPNDDADKQGVTFTRNGVGDYVLHNTLGIAQEGWQIELPQDNNRNPLLAIETSYLENGDLNIRTYKRIFSMQTFTFGCDYDSPIDIPDGRCVDVRLHEILPDAEQPTP